MVTHTGDACETKSINARHFLERQKDTVIISVLERGVQDVCISRKFIISLSLPLTSYLIAQCSTINEIHKKKEREEEDTSRSLT